MKVKKWLWAYLRSDGEWEIYNRFYSEKDAEEQFQHLTKGD